MIVVGEFGAVWRAQCYEVKDQPCQIKTFDPCPTVINTTTTPVILAEPTLRSANMTADPAIPGLLVAVFQWRECQPSPFNCPKTRRSALSAQALSAAGPRISFAFLAVAIGGWFPLNNSESSLAFASPRLTIFTITTSAEPHFLFSSLFWSSISLFSSFAPLVIFHAFLLSVTRNDKDQRHYRQSVNCDLQRPCQPGVILARR